ncbi:MAG: polysaccharide export protein [Myxococcales bacterium]|nr:polysaccharide export protein [Myxococcales bacterium]MDH3482674.1 polysaccharide export protein [Myxococcales bacterium]
MPSDDPAFAAPEPVVMPGLETDPPEALKLMPGDIVELTTVSAQTTQYPGLIVDALGNLHVPLAGDVPVGGKTLTEAEKAIEAGLRRYDRFARANLIITQPDGHVASVLGAVGNPGRIPVPPGMRVADLFAAASGGGEVRLASENMLPNLDLARLMRDGETVPVSIPLAIKGDPKHNVRVRSGDQLYVPPGTEMLIMVLGQVGAPQPIAYRQGMRLTEVLARAGGITGEGDQNDVRIVRGPLREPRMYTASIKDLVNGKATDVQLAPGDIVYVTKAWYTKTGDVLNALSPLISLANSAAIIAVAEAIRRP